MRVALTLLLIAVCSTAAAAAPENLHRQRQNFEYSSSSKKYVNNELADENENSGYYRAQHGNMGGNFVESHNMDAEAQRQLDELKRLADEMSQKSFGLDGSTSQQSSLRIFGGHSLGGYGTGELGQQTETFGNSFGSGYRTGAVSQQGESFGTSFGSGFSSDRVGQRTQSLGSVYGSGHRISDIGQETENIDRSRYNTGASYNLRGGQQTEGSGHNHQHSRFYGSHSHSGKLNSLGHKAEECDDQHTNQFTSQGVVSYGEIPEPLSKSTLNIGSLNTGLGHGQRRYFTTSYTSPVVQRTQTSRYYTTQNAGDRYSQQPSDQLTQETRYYGRRGYDKDQQVEDFGQQTVDLGQQTEDLGQQTIELGQQTEDFGQQTVDLGQQTEDFNQQSIHVGQKTEDLGQQVQTSIVRKPTYIGQTNSGVTSRTPYSSTVYIRYPTQTTYTKPVTTDFTRTNRTQFVSVVRTEHIPKPGSNIEPDLEIDTANLSTNKPLSPSLSVKPLESDSLIHQPHNKPAQPSVNLDAHMATLDKHMEELLKLSQHLHLDKSSSDTSTTQVSYNLRRSTTPRPTRPSSIDTSYFHNQDEDLGQQTQHSQTLEWYQKNQEKPKSTYSTSAGESYTSSKFDSQQTDLGQQRQQIGFQLGHETLYKPSNEQELLIGQQTQQNIFSTEHGNLETERQTVGNRNPNSGIYLQSKPERNPSQTEKIKYLSEDDYLGQQTEDLGQQTQQQVFQSQYSGKMEWNQATGSYNKPISQKPSPQPGSSRYPTYLGQQTEDLGQQTEDLGQQTEDLGQHNEDLGQQTQIFDFQSQHSGNMEWNQDSGSFRKPVTPKSTLKPEISNVPVMQNPSLQTGSSRHTTYLGQQTENLGQQTEDLRQQSQKFDFQSQHSGNLEWDKDLGSYRKPVTPKSVQPEISRYPAHLGQQTEDLGQQTQKFAFESQQTGKLEWNQETGSYNKPLSGQSSFQIGRQRYPTNLGSTVEDLGQQTEGLEQETEYLGQQSENLGQQTQQSFGIDLGQETSGFGQWNQNEESLTQQSSRDIINREKEGQLLVGNKFTIGRPQYSGTHSYSQNAEQSSDRNIGRGNLHLGVIGLEQHTLTRVQDVPNSQKEDGRSSYPQGQTTSSSTYNKHNQQSDSSRLQSASHTVRRGDQALTHTSEEDKIGQTAEHAPGSATLGNAQSFAISGGGSATYGTDSQGILGESDLLGIIGGGTGKVSGSFSQASSSSSSYSHSASGSFTGRNRTGQSSHLNSGNLQYGTQHQLGENFDQQTEELRTHTLQNAAHARRTEHGSYSGESSANLENQQTEDIGQQVGQFHFSSESSSSKHEEHQERSSFDIISGAGVSTNADIQLETTTPQEKRGFWGSLGHKAKNLAGKVRDSLG